MDLFQDTFEIACGTVRYVEDGTTRVDITPGYFSSLNALLATNNVAAAFAHHTYVDFVECLRYDHDPDKLFSRAGTLSNLQNLAGVSRPISVSYDKLADSYAALIPEQPKYENVEVDTYDNTHFITYTVSGSERASSAPSNDDGYDPYNDIGRFYQYDDEYYQYGSCSDGLYEDYGGSGGAGVGVESCEALDCPNERGYKEVIHAFVHLSVDAATVLFKHYFGKDLNCADPFSMGYCYFLFFTPAVRTQFFIPPLRDMPRILDYVAWNRFNQITDKNNFSDYVAFKLTGSFVHLVPLDGSLVGYTIASGYKVWRALDVVFKNPDVDYVWNGDTFVEKPRTVPVGVTVGRQSRVMEDIHVPGVSVPAPVRSIYLRFQYNNGIVGLNDVMMTRDKLDALRSFLVNFDMYVTGKGQYVASYSGHYVKLKSCVNAVAAYLDTGVHDNLNNLVGAFERSVRSYMNVITNNALIREEFLKLTKGLPWLFKHDERFLQV